MDIEVRLHATVREQVGRKSLCREYETPPRVENVLESLAAEYPDADLFATDGSLREHLTVVKNGRNVALLDGLDTELSDGDTLSVFPSVAGG